MERIRREAVGALSVIFDGSFDAKARPFFLYPVARGGWADADGVCRHPAVDRPGGYCGFDLIRRPDSRAVQSGGRQLAVATVTVTVSEFIILWLVRGVDRRSY